MALDLTSKFQTENSAVESNIDFGSWGMLLVLLTSAILWVMSWYGETLISMVETWFNSETFAHGFLIAPITVWMIWRRRHKVSSINPTPNFWMLLPMMLAGFVWLLGALAGVVVVQQYCFVLIVLCLTATILGTAVVRELAFPLLFLLFAVPFGEFLLPWLMDHTADFAVFALRLTGIPVYREGLFFTLPSGNWSVVEACSGLRYLIASVTLGFLYAYLTYRSFSRRAIFVILSIGVPIIANWVRAYMIVMIGHLSSMQLAAGVDHLIYGWLFFGVVMLLLFWLGSFWREDLVIPQEECKGDLSKPIDRPAWITVIAATLFSAGVTAAPPTLASYLQQGYRELPISQVPPAPSGWRLDTGRIADWNPHYLNPSAQIRQIYSSETSRIELFIGHYRNQRKNAQLITSVNSLVHSSNTQWGNVASTRRTLDLGDKEIDVVVSKLRGKSSQLLVLHWFWIDGHFTVNRYWAKLLQAKSQLLGRGDDGAVFILSSEDIDGSNISGDRLSEFARLMAPAISASLRHAK